VRGPVDAPPWNLHLPFAPSVVMRQALPFFLIAPQVRPRRYRGKRGTYPPAPLVVRAASKRQELGGFRLIKGHTVTVSIYAMQRHRSFWDAADAFDPDRFLPERLGSNPAYMPFGTGPRMCIAAQFALAEIIVVVARLLAELDLAPAGPQPQVTLQVTTRSATGLNVVAQRRGC